jgi:23S rRNA (cytosine1962-C5)-methyltransferase
MPYSKIFLKPGKEKSIRNFHPWIFSGAVARMESGISDGSIAEVYSHDKEYLGTGFCNNGTIAVRIFSFRQCEADREFWKQKLEKAFALRQQLHLVSNPETNVYRLVHGEGDGLPGLIIDIYNDTAVLQAHNLGMHGIRNEIAEALLEISQGGLTAVYDKSSETMPKIPGMQFANSFLAGSSGPELVVQENGNRFHIDITEGQKTGYFVDQRENRRLLGEYARGRNVLNTFCYSGAFSIYALRGGATSVHSLDSSRKAMELTDRNVALNGFESRHESFTADAFDFLREIENRYDLIVLDPPAFAKHQSALKNAAMGYQRLNRIAFEKIKPGGILFTFSCSQVVDKTLFRQIVFAAAAQSRRTVRILHQLSQPADHPVSIYHPEGEYLKGLVLHVE